MTGKSTENKSETEAERVAAFPARFESLEDVRQFVGAAAQECGFPENKVYSIQLAVDEAVTNIIEHSYGGECQEDIECTCQMNSKTFTVVLKDCGTPFNPESVPPPDLTSSLQDRREGGLGLFFMRQLMDEVRFKFIPGKGGKAGCNILTMIKKKEAAS